MARKTDQRTDLPWDEIIRSSRSPHPKRRARRFLKVLFYMGLFLSVIALLATGVYTYAELKLPNEENLNVAVKVPDEPTNVLILGSDSREALSEEERRSFGRLGGRRSDTIILLHVDEKREKSVLVHFPRDLRVQLPDGTQGRINSAYNQGPDAVIQTVSNFTGLPIHHYVEVNFVGFRNIVNTLGGVDVYFEEPIRERDSGINVASGCVHLEGDQALAFVRVRKIDSDFGRIRRQQLFMKLMMEKVMSPGTLLNPVKVVKLVNLVSDNIKTDQELSVFGATNIAGRLRRFDTRSVDMRVIPSHSQLIGGVSYVIHQPDHTAALLAAIKERRPLPDYGRTGVSAIAPQDIRVAVLNGTRATGLAARGADELREKEFEVIGIGNADRSDYQKTVVFFQVGNGDKASMLASLYGAEIHQIPRRPFENAELALVLGRDYAEGRAIPPPPTPENDPPEKPLIHEC